MNKITYAEMFKNTGKRNEGVFIPFVVAGDPNYEISLKVVKKLVDSGADALEIGFTFSDPIADGPSVQNADLRASNSGMTVEKSFEFLEEVRQFTEKPIGLLLYFNLVYKYGVEKFYKRLNSIGINAVLIADLPPEESGQVEQIAHENKIEQIFIVSQATSNARLEKISSIGSGFIYAASVMGTTGIRSNVEKNTTELIKRIKNGSNLPVCVGFGISRPEHVEEVLSAGADGAIVGSAIINIIEGNLDNEEEMLKKVSEYVKNMKKATKRM